MKFAKLNGVVVSSSANRELKLEEIPPTSSSRQVRTDIGIIVVLVLIIFFTLNFMYLTPDRLKWGSIYSKFPIVKYKVNPSMIGFNTGDKNQILDLIQNSASLWSFQSGESHFQFSYNGMSTSEPVGYDAMGCTEEVKESVRALDNLVYASNIEDSDCSGQACTYIWSCEGNGENMPPEILHFDMEINARDYEWDTGTNHKKSYNLFTIVAKQFGQLLGLSHCSPCDSETACQAQVSIQGTSNPTNDSLLYKFIEPEVIRSSLSSDDKAGLIALYGGLTSEEIAMKAEMQSFTDKANSYCTLHCVTPDKETNEKYVLSSEEQQAIQIYWQEIKDQGKDNQGFYISKYKWIQDSYNTAYSYNGKSAEYYLLDMIENFDYYHLQVPMKEMMENERILLAVQITTREKLLNDAKQELDAQFYKFIENELKILIQMRRKFIDASL